jgi:hypothetical protein
MSSVVDVESGDERVVSATCSGDLEQLREAGVQAVLLPLSLPPAWMVELACLSAEDAFNVPRTILHGVTLTEIEASVNGRLAASGLPPGVTGPLRADMLSLVETCRRLTGCDRFRFRFLTDTPNCDCNFHVDTVPPRVPTAGVLRVYFGAGTEYLDPAGLTSWMDFYRYVFDRHRLTRRAESGDAEARHAATAARDQIDRCMPFISDLAAVKAVPAGTLVAMKLVDGRFLWAEHLHARKARGWIHRSPMQGARRFMVSVNAV